MPCRVLHVLTSDERRGAQSFGYLLHEELTAMGWQSDVVALTATGAPGGLPVSPLASHRYAPRGLVALRRRAASAEVVVAHGSSTLAACGVALAASGLPFVYVNIGDPRFWWRGRLRRARVRMMLRRAALVVAISPSAGRLLVADVGLRPSRVTVIPNGRKAEDFPPTDAARRRLARRDLGLDGDGSVLMWVGALSPEKRPALAVEVVARLEGVQLCMVGDGPEREDVTRLADRVAPGRVQLLGRSERVGDLLSAADAVLLTSESEGLPGVLIEAGLMGLPAVAVDVGWVADVVLDGVTGALVPGARPDDLAAAVRTVLADATALGDAARSHCLEHFELRQVVERWAATLDGVVQSVGITSGTPRG